jgi:hypothetical protein
MEKQNKLEIILKKSDNNAYDLFIKSSFEGLRTISQICQINQYNGSLLDGKESLEEHYLINQCGFIFKGDTYKLNNKLVGIAHSKEELSNKIYKLAITEAKKEAKKYHANFIDLTENNKEQNSEQKEICNSFGHPLTGPRAEKLRRLSGKY